VPKKLQTAEEPIGWKPILCLDFDGVCHSYTSGWKGATTIPDPPVDGLFEFIEAAVEYFDIQIFSTRSADEGGPEAMAEWFYNERKKWKENGGIGGSPVRLVGFPTEKPPAFVTIDDRAITFAGTWPDVQEIRKFKPWNKK
jgi:hypothetical protein